MDTIKARVINGRLVVDEPSKFPDGTELALALVDEDDELTEEERTNLHAALQAAWASVRAGQSRSVENLLKTPEVEVKAEVGIAPQAEEQALEVDSWWERNRPGAPRMFAEDLLGAIDLIAPSPDIGRQYRRAGIPGLRRILLPHCRYHVYYLHEPETGIAIIVAVWSALRGRGPDLRRP